MIHRDDPFIQWIADKARNNRWSLDACFGYARRNKLYPEEQTPCSKTLYNELWAGNKPISLSCGRGTCQSLCLTSLKLSAEQENEELFDEFLDQVYSVIKVHVA